MLNNLYKNTINEVLNNNQTSCDIANKVLYALCNHELLPNVICALPQGDAVQFNKEYVAAQLLLISKSYSASFDRRNYVGDDYKGLKDFKTKSKAVGTGNGEFFYELANRLVNIYRKEYEAIMRSFAAMTEYDFSSVSESNYCISKNDFSTLKNVIRAVCDFDELICKCINEYDTPILSEYKEKNKIEKDAVPTHHYSACSKFLHFHFPSLVFILDFYAERHLDFHQQDNFNNRDVSEKPKRNTSKGAVITFCYNDKFLCTNITRDKENQLINQMKDELNNYDERYLIYACRVYLIAKDMNDRIKNPDFPKYAPRIVDTLQSKVNIGLE